MSLNPSFRYPQYMFWLRNEKNNFQLRTGGGAADTRVERLNVWNNYTPKSILVITSQTTN